jgi:hypothetical protein
LSFFFVFLFFCFPFLSFPFLSFHQKMDSSPQEEVVVQQGQQEAKQGQQETREETREEEKQEEEEPEDIRAFRSTLTPQEEYMYQLARSHFTCGFSLRRTNAYCAWRKKHT